jgi:hypothetical protein
VPLNTKRSLILVQSRKGSEQLRKGGIAEVMLAGKDSSLIAVRREESSCQWRRIADTVAADGVDGRSRWPHAAGAALADGGG